VGVRGVWWLGCIFRKVYSSSEVQKFSSSEVQKFRSSEVQIKRRFLIQFISKTFCAFLRALRALRLKNILITLSQSAFKGSSLENQPQKARRNAEKIFNSVYQAKSLRISASSAVEVRLINSAIFLPGHPYL
jgi:hypothetical protein